MRVLGIDLSFSPGVAIVDKTGLVVSDSIQTTAEQPWGERVEIIKDLVIRFAQSSDVIYMENYAYNAKFGREVLGELGGVIKWYLTLHNKEIKRLIAPTQIKKFATGRGRAPVVPVGEAKSTWGKKWMINEVNKNFGQGFKIHDEADAFMVATVGLTLESIEAEVLDVSTLPKHQQAVVRKILRGNEKDGRKNNTKGGSRKQSGKRGRGNSKKSGRA